MNLERAALMGRQAELKQKRLKLENRIEGAAKAIRIALNTSLHPVDELAVPEIDEQWDQLKGAWTELAVVNSDLARIDKELH